MRRFRRKYASFKIFDARILKEQKQLIVAYGLRNKKELKQIQGFIKSFQRVLRDYELESTIAQSVLEKLFKLGIIEEKSESSIQNMKLTNFLQRRLQTLIARLKNISMNNARQLIVHGHIKVNGTIIRSPSYLIRKTSTILVDNLES